MIRFLSVFLVVLLMLVPAALAESPDWSQYSDDDLRRMRDEISVMLSVRALEGGDAGAALLAGDLGPYHLEAIAIERMQDHQDAPCLVVTYRFTNNSDAAATMLRVIDTKAFQGGVQCKNPTLIIGVNPNDMALEVKPGASITVQKGYSLYDENSPVDFEFRLTSAPTAAPLCLTYLLQE